MSIYNVEAGKTYILNKLLETRYITPYVTQFLKSLLNECKSVYELEGKMVTIDIQHCKFNPDNYREICIFSDSVNFIDSDNPVIDSMLDHNSRVHQFRRLEKSGEIIIETIPVEFTSTSIAEFLSNIDKNKLYRLKGFRELNGKEPYLSVLVAMFIGLRFPKVSVDLSEQADKYFNTFRKFWIYTGLVKRDAYNILWMGNILKVEVVSVDRNGDNIFYIPGVGEITEDTLNDNFIVIPYDFGKLEKEEIQKDPELKDMVSKIGAEIQQLLNKKKKKKLTSELSTIEGS